MNKGIVIDANITLAQVLPLSYSQWVEQRIKIWREEQVQIIVPYLWRYEVVSGLRKAVARGYLNQDQAVFALEATFKMKFNQQAPSIEFDIAALSWADKLNQSNAYDTQYLAVAEALGAEFWSADQRLVNNSHQVGANWVHWIGE